jgi:hypothetical protein
LARYASDPKSITEKVNIAATKYGNRAHAAIGRGPSVAGFVIIGILIIIAAKMAGLF